MEYFIGSLKNYADFSGRVSRKEYWMFILFYLIFFIATIVIDVVFGATIFSILYSLALLVPSVSIAARRLHDTGGSGWWQLITVLPIVGTLILFKFLVEDSRGENEYGASPKFET